MSGCSLRTDYPPSPHQDTDVHAAGWGHAAGPVSYLGGPAALVALGVLAHHPVLLLDGLVIWKRKHMRAHLTSTLYRWDSEAGGGGWGGATLPAAWPLTHLSSWSCKNTLRLRHGEAAGPCLHSRRSEIEESRDVLKKHSHALTEGGRGAAAWGIKTSPVPEISCRLGKQSWEGGARCWEHITEEWLTTSKTGREWSELKEVGARECTYRRGGRVRGGRGSGCVLCTAVTNHCCHIKL